MEKIKRKSRNKLSNKYDILFPIPIDDIGSENDPCFGKLFSPTDPICQRCGDSEICQIKMSQIMHSTRSKIESQGKFKDMEEKDIYQDQGTKSNKSLTKEDRVYIRKMLRKKIKIFKEVQFDDLVFEVLYSTKTKNYPKIKIEQQLRRLCTISNHITLKDNNTVVWTN